MYNSVNTLTSKMTYWELGLIDRVCAGMLNKLWHRFAVGHV